MSVKGSELTVESWDLKVNSLEFTFTYEYVWVCKFWIYITSTYIWIYVHGYNPNYYI